MFDLSSKKLGLDQAVLKGVESGQSERGLSKEEVEKLLRHGAYDMFNEDKAGAAEAESNYFVQQDIDSILERHSRTVVHEDTGSKSNAAGGTFSKARFVAASKTPEGEKSKGMSNDIDIEDPDFWTKMLGEAKPETFEDLASKPRQRARTNYSEIDYQKKFEESLRPSDAGSDSGNESDSSFDEQVDGGSERSRWDGALPTEWKKDDVESIVKFLMTKGYGMMKWSEIASELQLSKEYGEDEVSFCCSDHRLLCSVSDKPSDFEDEAYELFAGAYCSY